MYLSVVFLRRHFVQNVSCSMLIARLCMVVSCSTRPLGYSLRRLKVAYNDAFRVRVYSMFQDGSVHLHCLYLMVLLHLMLLLVIFFLTSKIVPKWHDLLYVRRWAVCDLLRLSSRT